MKKGFTLIELMIVVAIVGILTMMAMPFYSDYVKRTYVTEGFANLGPLKSALIDFYNNHGRMPNNFRELGPVVDVNYQHSSGIQAGVYETSPKTFVQIYKNIRGDLTLADKYGGVLYLYVTEDIQEKPNARMPAEVPIMPIMGDGSITWICGAEAVRQYPTIATTVWGTNSIRDKYLPAECRAK
ncbi:pilin [Wohlfahrtiimonas larvae]|uniref:Fimbrial major subunit PilE n=1 Tax=Wohlfahrtiimonas larvae TaxID=1157986 RepID=A0ABP9MHM8_9GAMM|nr:prepilin-type N-terminal cleavage/methylation domain-containing protein [Wohlfahrtiimonas larvae]